MSERIRRKRKMRLKGIIRLIIIMGVFIFFIVKLVQWNMTDRNATYTLTYGEFKIDDHYEAVIIRDEVLLMSPSTGKVTRVASDGDRVKRNQRILDITGVESMESIEASTETLEETVELEASEEEVDLLITSLKAEIALSVKKSDYSSVDELADELALKIVTLNQMLASDSRSSDVVVMNNVSLDIGETTPFTIDTPGILTYYIDGYEDTFTYDKVSSLKFDQIDSMEILPYMPSPHYVNQGDVIGKIIRDSEYYLVIIVEQSDYNEFDIYKDVTIRTDSKTLTGTIENFISTGEKVAIPIKVDEHIEGFYKDRTVNIKIEQETYKGLTIKTSSLVNSTEGMGVYVVDKLDKVRFKPVKIIASQDDTVIVKNDMYYEFIDDRKEKIDTVSIYDRVILNADDYKPGDIVK